MRRKKDENSKGTEGCVFNCQGMQANMDVPEESYMSGFAREIQEEKYCSKCTVVVKDGSKSVASRIGQGAKRRGGCCHTRGENRM